MLLGKMSEDREREGRQRREEKMLAKTKRTKTLSDCELMKRCSLTRAGVMFVDAVTANIKVKLDQTTTSARFQSPSTSKTRSFVPF